MHNEYYPFDIKSKRMMMKIDINAFFKLGDAFFEIHEMEDSSVRTFWRKAVPERKYAEYAGTIARKYYEGKLMHLKELILTDEYKKEIAFISPINEVSLRTKKWSRIYQLHCKDDYPKIKTK